MKHVLHHNDHQLGAFCLEEHRLAFRQVEKGAQTVKGVLHELFLFSVLGVCVAILLETSEGGAHRTSDKDTNG